MTDVGKLVAEQKAFFYRDRTKSVDFRIAALKKLQKALNTYRDDLLEALEEDLSKSRSEAYMTEIGIVESELEGAIKNVRKWSRPERVRGTLASFPAKHFIYPEPYGVALIMSPWNYPVNLTLSPLIAAMAAGNTAVIKPSKKSASTSKVLGKIINTTFDRAYVHCLDPETDYDEVLEQDYDFIFFTGSPKVGRRIGTYAGAHLIPTLLELGGKSPCFVDRSADIDGAAKRIAWGKFLNAGQTCIAVDYVLVDQKVKDALVEALVREIRLRYPDATESATYPKIINRDHYDRLVDLIRGEEQVLGGRCDEHTLKIAPTLLTDVDFDHRIMEEEIFGPLLPIISYDDRHRAIQAVKKGDKPLACYVFTEDKAWAEEVIGTLSYGGGCINDVAMHLSNPRLPFGGVGNSGMGHYHGKHGFDALSHKKSVLKNHFLIDVPLRYAPFTPKKLKWIKRFL